MQNYTIEPLKIDDYEKCSNIWNMAECPFTDEFGKEIASGNRTVYIYKINGEFIAECALVKEKNDSDYTIAGKRIYMSRFIVKKEYRNRGIGSVLLEFMIEKARESGYSEISIGVDKDNERALHLYRKFGFDEILYEGADECGEYYKLLKRI